MLRLDSPLKELCLLGSARAGVRLRGTLLCLALALVLLLLVPLQAGANPITDENAQTGHPTVDLVPDSC